MPKILTVNRGNSVMVSVINQVNSATIRRETQNGESYIVVPSATLPDDVVMNGGLYPADEIEKSFMTLEGTHVPIEHPQDDQGQYISAGAPAAMRRGYLIGAENRNAKRENGRVYVEKWIPERIANGCDKGKRLIDRLNAIMKGHGEPIHTSTGILLEREAVEQATNAAGDSYTWIARNMVFDHDAILLDSIGAATPEKGVGIGVNSASIAGEIIDHLMFVANAEQQPDLPVAEDEQPQHDDKMESLASMLFNRIMSLFAQKEKPAYNAKDEKVNTSNEGSSMKLLIDALNAKGIKTDGMTDEQIFAAYNNMQSGSADQVVQAVNAALKPLADELATVKAQLQANAEAGKNGMVADLVAKDIGLSETALKSLELNELQSLHTKHCAKPAAGVAGGFQSNAADDYDMPE